MNRLRIEGTQLLHGQINILPAIVTALMIAFLLVLPGTIGTNLSQALALAPLDTLEQKQLAEKYADFPVYFTPNVGQFDRGVEVSAVGAGYQFFLTKKGVTYVFTRPGEPDPQAVQESLAGGEAYALKLDFVGADPQATVRGRARQAGYVNYFSGANEADWQTEIPTFARAEYGQLYKGIDLAYQGDKGKLKYEFTVAPGADYRQIQLAYSGADELRVDKNGDLIIGTPWGDLVDRKPYVYQLSGEKKVAVDARFVTSGNVVSFSLGRFDRSRPLVIDPGIEYSTFIGGDQYDYGLGITLDSSNNAYITGCTGSTNYPTTAGVYDPTHNGGWDVFVTKLNQSGSALVYSTFIGGTDLDRGMSIAVDETGDAYIAGLTESTNYPTTAGAYDRNISGSSLSGAGVAVASSPNVTRQDAFVTKLNSTGTALVYSTYLGGKAIDWAAGIAIDNSGNAYVAGGPPLQ